MKKLKVAWKFIFIFVCLSSSLCLSQDFKYVSFIPEDNFKKATELNYKEFKVYEYIYKHGNIDSSSKKLLQHITLDNEGKILTNISLYDKQVYKYNNANRLIEINHYNTSGKKHKRVWKYHNDTILLEKTYSTNKYKDVTKYDNKGNEIYYIQHVNNKLTSESNTTNQYDDTGKLIQKKTISQNSSYFVDMGMRIGVVRLRYGMAATDNLIESHAYGGARKNQIDTVTTIYTYNEKGKIIKEV